MRYLTILYLIINWFDVSGQHSNNLLEHTIKGTAQGTTYSIKYYSTEQILKNEVDSILDEIDNSMSIYKPDSKISKFNDPKTKKIKMDHHMTNVIQESFKTYSMTGGYFDITIMPLVSLWGFGPMGFKNIPSEVEIKRARSVVGMNNILQKNGYLIKKKKNVSIDVNGIAQGYSVDVLSDYFLSKNITNFIIEVGGEIITRGVKLQGDFVVEIQRPYPSPENTSYKIKLKDKAITTSGTYEKQIEMHNKFVSHHIDPKTGFPIENKTISVTVIANSAMQADAIDNYLLFINPDEAIKFVENQKDIEVYIVYIENNILKELQSSGFNNYIYN